MGRSTHPHCHALGAAACGNPARWRPGADGRWAGAAPAFRPQTGTAGAGRQAPVLLRAPYFSRMRDILVSADQCIVLAGAEVEYLFSTEAVLARAQHLTDGRSAYHDGRRMIAGTVSLDIGAPDLIAGEDLAFLSASHDRVLAPPPLPILRHYEAVPLLALLGRGNGRRAA
ncbi:Hint domain-containing protein [Gemmobacter lanyuensis]